MRERKFLCIGWIPFLLCTLIMLAITLAFKWRDIEKGVAKSAQIELSTQEHTWAKVETFNRGRNVLITGTAPSEQAKLSALAVAGSAYGVREATFAGKVEASSGNTSITTRDSSEKDSYPDSSSKDTSVTDLNDSRSPSEQNAMGTTLAPAELNASSKGDKVTLSGRLSSQREADSLMADALRVFGIGNIVNNLTVTDDVAPLENTNFLSALKFDGDGVSNVNAMVNGAGLTLTGDIPNQILSKSIEKSANTQFEGPVLNQLVVSIPIIEEISCQERVNEILTQGKINFETAKSTISDDSHELLGLIYAAANRCPEATFEVAGHTDNTGNLESNMTLSKRRAQSVVDYLVELGLANERLTAAGYGPKSPVADNSTDQGRTQNRRIEFKLRN